MSKTSPVIYRQRFRITMIERRSHLPLACGADDIIHDRSAHMALINPKNPKIKGLNEVGRYAVGVQWVDGHDSIFPIENLRRYCPCDQCKGKVEGEIAAEQQRMRQFTRLGEQAVFIGWSDGHETLY